jgi:hypothetical protein
MFFLNFTNTEQSGCQVYLRVQDGKEEKLEGIQAVEDDGDNALQNLFQEVEEDDEKAAEEKIVDNFNNDLDISNEKVNTLISTGQVEL